MFIVFLIIQLGIMYFLNILGISSEANAYIFIIFNMIYMVSLFIKKYKDISLYLLIAYFGRVLFMLWDLYARHIFVFPGSGADTEAFYKTSVLISNNIELLKENIHGGVYTKILGGVFNFVGENRILGQYINVLLGMGVVILVYKSLKKLNITKRNTYLAVLIISLFPNALINSAILLRENFITYFVALSVYYFVKWYKEGKISNQFFSILFILLASSFHSGVIGVLLGYVFYYIYYDREKSKLEISLKSILLLIGFFLLSIVILNNSNTFLGKFANVEEIDDIVATSNFRLGGSQYLQSLQTNNVFLQLVYSPIFMFYFLISPLPWNFRGFNDLLTFFMDSIFYTWFLYMIFISFQKIEKMKENKYIILALSLSIFITVFIFSFGVANAGTALRHRHKILPLFVMLMAIIKDELYDKDFPQRL